MSKTTLNRTMKINYDFLPFVLVRNLKVEEIVSKIIKLIWLVLNSFVV